MNRIPYLRLVAGLTAFFHAGSSLAAQTGFLTASPESSVLISYNSAEEPTAGPPFNIDIPRALGMQSGFYSPRGAIESSGSYSSGELPFVIHIQDAHANLEAQNKISELLNWLKSQGLSDPDFPFFVALEGAVGPLVPEYMDMFPAFPEVNKAIVSDLLQKGELSGPELFIWNEYIADKKTTSSALAVPPFRTYSGSIAYGVESPELYRQNLHQYRTLLSERESINRAFAPLGARLAIAGSRVLNPQLRDFIRESERVETLFSSVLKHLEINGIDLTRPVEQIRFPHLSRFVKIQRLEPLLDTKLSKMEWDSLKNAFLPKDKESFFNSLEKALFEENAASYAWRESLAVLSKELKGLSKMADYPHFWRWISYQVLRSEIESKSLMLEVENLRASLINAMAVTEEEKAYVVTYENFSFLKKLLLGEISRDEHKLIELDKQKFLPSAILKTVDEMLDRKKIPAAILSGHSVDEAALNDYYKKAMEFYTGALARDEALLENALAVFGSLQDFYSVAHKRRAGSVFVLVTGGFHSDGLTQLLKSRHIPHLVVTPSIMSAGDPSLYHRVMTRENADLSAYFRKSSLNKQQSIFLKSLLETAPPVLARDHGVSPRDIPAVLQEALGNHPVLADSLKASIEPSGERPAITIKTSFRRDEFPDEVQSTIKDVALINPASGFAYLASESAPAGVPAASFSMGISDGGYPTVDPLVPEGSLASRVASGGIIGSIKVESGPINPEVLEAASGQLRDLMSVLGSGSVAPPSRRPLRRASRGPISTGRSELRSEDAPKVGVIDVDKTQLNVDAILEIIRNNDIINIIADVPQLPTDYPKYEQTLIKYADHIGKALKRFREEDPSNFDKHKVFVFKTWTAVGSTEESEISEFTFFKVIKYTREPPAHPADDFYFDVVYRSPAFEYVNEEGKQVQDVVALGIRNYGVEGLSQDAEDRRARTIEMLTRAAEEAGEKEKLEFTNVKTAEQVTWDLITLLFMRLVHFNDKAAFSDTYGADIDVVALGAGLDSRLRRLASNPSLGVGGRLAHLFDWFIEQRLEIAWRRLGPTGFFPEGTQDKKERINEILKEALKELRKIAVNAAEAPESFEERFRALPIELRHLLMLKNMQQLNNEHTPSFVENKISAKMGENLTGKKVAISGFGFRTGESRILRSPAQEIITRLIAKGVREFYISDPKARAEILKWRKSVESDEKNEQQLIFLSPELKFHGVDPGTPDINIYEAFEQADFAIIATEADPELHKLDLQRLQQSMAGKYLFDGVNLFGLRANGRRYYSFDELEDTGVKYVSVGRPALNVPDEKPLKDSVLLGIDTTDGSESPSKEKIQAYHDYILSIQTDDARRAELAAFFAARGDPDKEALANPAIKKKIVMIGGGYVGLVTAALLADLGHDVTVIDLWSDPKKVAAMEALQGPGTVVPIHEPGLKELIEKNKAAGRIRFIADKEGNHTALMDAQIVFMAVGTPMSEETRAQDTGAIKSAFYDVAAVIKELRDAGDPRAFKTFVVKSTVTPLLFENVDYKPSPQAPFRISASLRNDFGLDINDGAFGLASNPEFLKEGDAIADITDKLMRTVLGLAEMPSEAALQSSADLLEMYEPLMVRHPHVMLLTNAATSTEVKYGANSLLGDYISGTNVMADASVKDGVDFWDVARILRKDLRVGGPESFLFPGCGYGGSCFPKDKQAEARLAFNDTQRPLMMTEFSEAANTHFQAMPAFQLIDALRDGKSVSPARVLAGKTIAIWGLTFKPRTDDMRETPPSRIVAELLKIGGDEVKLRLDDPISRTKDAPAWELKIADFKHELYKRFKRDPAFLKAIDEAQSSRSIYHAAYQAVFGALDGSGAMVMRPVNKRSNEDKEKFFLEVYLKVKEDAGIVTFVRSKEAAIEGAHGLIIGTDWSEYKDADITLFSPKLKIIDPRNALARIHKELREKKIVIVTSGRTRLADFERSELRYDISITNNKGSLLDTSQFAAYFANDRIPGYSGASLEDLLAGSPMLEGEREVMQMMDFFYDPQLFTKVEPLIAWRFLQYMLTSQGTMNVNALPEAVDKAREALEAYGWLLDESEMPVTIIHPLANETASRELLQVAGVFAAVNPEMRFVFTVPGRPEEARALMGILTERLRALKLPVEQIVDQFEFIATENTVPATVKTIKQVWSGGQKQKGEFGVIHPSRDLLESVQYMGNMARIKHSIPESQAIPIAAALLRKILEDNRYDVVNLEDAVRRYNIDFEGLVESVASMIRVLNHLATQA